VGAASADAMSKLVFWFDNAQPGFALYTAHAGKGAVVSFLLVRRGEALPPLRLSTAEVWQHPGAILFSTQALRCTAQALASRLRMPANATRRRVACVTSLRPFAWTAVPAPWPTDLRLWAERHGAAWSADEPAACDRYPSAWTMGLGCHMPRESQLFE
jgi:hypothetical protein